MDLNRWLDLVVSECGLLEEPGDALRLLPDLSTDAPVPQELDLAEEPGGEDWGFPVRFSHPLRGDLAPFLVGEVARLLDGGARETPTDLVPDKLGKEPLVGCLARLLGEAAFYGPRTCSVVLCEMARQSSLLLHGDEQEVREAAGGGSVGMEAHAKALGALEARKRGEVLGDVAYALSGRLSAAWQIAQRFNASARPTRLYKALVQNKLALVLPPQAFQPEVHFPFAAGCLGLDVDDAVLVGIHRAVTAAVVDGLQGNSETSAVLRALAAGRSQPSGLALEAPVAAWALHGMSGILGPGELRKAGVKRSQAKAICRQEGAGSAAAIHALVGETLRTWDLLATVCARTVPVWRLGREVRSTRGALKGALKWEMLVPRGESATVEADVVLVRMGPATAQVLEKANDGQKGAALLAIQGVWDELARRARDMGGLAGRIGEDGVALFSNAREADAFGAVAEGRFTPPIRLELDPLASPLALPGRAVLEVCRARGPVQGGWSGESLNVRGELIDGMRGGGSVPQAVEKTATEHEQGMALLTEPTDEVEKPRDVDGEQAGLTLGGTEDSSALETVDEFFLPPPREIIGDLAELPPEEEEALRQSQNVDN
jgi:hypothetical protein